MVQFYDSLTETQTQDAEMYCHTLLAGLTVTDYCFEHQPGKRILQKPRSPSPDTNRTGKEVSFEELANVFRTSRVTLSNVYNRTLEDIRRQIQKGDNGGVAVEE